VCECCSFVCRGLIDLNCGCPKKFSTSGNMGAALLKDPETLTSILTALKEHVNLPISCKIRVLDTNTETIALMRAIEETGVCAIAVHFRTREMKSSEAALWDRVEEICKSVSLPIVINGDVFRMEDIRELKKRAVDVGYMVARGAQSTPYVFHHLKQELAIDKENCNAEDEKSLTDILREYAKLCMLYDMPFQNAKYVLCQMSPARASKVHASVCLELGIDYFHGSVSRMKSYPELAVLFGQEEYLKELVASRIDTLKIDLGDYSDEYKYIPDGAIIPNFKRKIDEC